MMEPAEMVGLRVLPFRDRAARRSGLVGAAVYALAYLYSDRKSVV